ncbi:MAG: radical SAM protein, partial [Planctomycetaceae bacterium]
MLKLRDHTFLGTTQSLCPECLALVPAKIVVRPNRRVYFRKHCPTHGIREDFVCSDVRWYDRTEFLVPGKVPAQFGTEPDKGCPYDCGLCTEHEQHTCIALAEITSSCNLQCPMCFASSGPGGRHWTFEEACRAIDRVVAVETRPEVLQLSGGEPTLHPQFEQIFEYACAQPIDYVMINTNGIRLANDLPLVERIARLKHRAEIYLQFDGLHDGVNQALRGESLLATKLRAIENLGRVGLHTTLVCTLQPDVNFDQLGPLVEFAAQRPWICGLSLQPATYSGRHVLPEELERRITFPDVVTGLVQQTAGLFAEDDFLPLPCAHPNCHTLTYAFRAGARLIPLTRFINPSDSIDLLSNGITFTRPKARELIEKYLGRLGCCAGGNCGPADA